MVFAQCSRWEGRSLWRRTLFGPSVLFFLGSFLKKRFLHFAAAVAIILISSGTFNLFLSLVALVFALTFVAASSSLACKASKPPSCPSPTPETHSDTQPTLGTSFLPFSLGNPIRPALLPLLHVQSLPVNFHHLWKMIPSQQPDRAQEPRRGLKITRSHNVILLFLSDTGIPRHAKCGNLQDHQHPPKHLSLYNENPSTTATSVFFMVGDLVLPSTKAFKFTKAVRGRSQTT